MKIHIASDHAGFKVKEEIAKILKQLKVEFIDYTPTYDAKDDYPDYASCLGEKVVKAKTKGILICGTGIGMSIAANRFKGIRAALCLFPKMAYYARRHNDANVLALGGGNTGLFLASEIVDIFLEEKFEGGRHKRRTDKFDLAEVNK